MGVNCEYPAARRPYGSGRARDGEKANIDAQVAKDAEVNADMDANADANALSFPDAFFLDRELFTSIAHADQPRSLPVRPDILVLLGDDYADICHAFFTSVDTWFPFVNRRRLTGRSTMDLPLRDPTIAALLLCMKLVAEVPASSTTTTSNNTSASTSLLYREAKAYLNVTENDFPTSLRVLQALVLLALFETGHGIFPAAYLTIGRAARMSVLRGVHDRKNATQLFRTPSTWTDWEEERRTWWATLILERSAE